MRSLRDLRGNTKSVKSTEQIMRAMKMVAAARVRKAQGAIISSRPFALELAKTLDYLGGHLLKDGDSLAASWTRWFYHRREQTGRVGLLVISADKGLCGAFNALIIKTALEWLETNRDKKIYLFTVGRKAYNFLSRLKGFDIEYVHKTMDIFPNVSYANAEMLGNEIIEKFISGKTESFACIYGEFRSALIQKPAVLNLLPIAEIGHKDAHGEYIEYEPNRKKFFEDLTPRYIKAEIYRMLLETQAAEISARVNAMESATKNAQEILETLTIELNRTRQAQITTELSEIVAGANAI